MLLSKRSQSLKGYILFDSIYMTLCIKQNSGDSKHMSSCHGFNVRSVEQMNYGGVLFSCGAQKGTIISPPEGRLHIVTSFQKGKKSNLPVKKQQKLIQLTGGG